MKRKEPAVMPSRRDRSGLRTLVLAIWPLALVQAFAQPVRAEVRISGQADALIVEAREAQAEEILAALRASFNLQYHTSGALNRVMTGTYTGSLQRVIARLLEGHNYIIHSSTGGSELIVLGPGGASSNVFASGRPAVAITASPSLTATEPRTPSSVSPDTSSGTITQALELPQNMKPGSLMAPLPVAMAAGDIPAFPAANNSLLRPPAPNSEFSIAPQTIPPPAGLVGPTSRPAPAGAAGP